MLGDDELDELVKRRRTTMVPLFKTIFQQFIWFAVFVIGLTILGHNPMPFLAGAGALGIVVGLGAQPLINDVVSGFFILFENTFLIGDFIEVGNAKGTVEAIDFRTTKIRDTHGRVHVIRNGEMREIINYSKEFVFAVVTISVSARANLDTVERSLIEAGALVAAENNSILEPTEVQGIANINDNEISYRTVTKVTPGSHGTVAMALRRKIFDLFESNNIAYAIPQRQIITITE